MIKKLALGTILGGVILFVWSFIAWTLIPWPGEPLRSFTNDDAVIAAIKANAPRSGNYLLPNEVKRTPGMTDEQYKAAQRASMDNMLRGPVVFAAIRLEPGFSEILAQPDAIPAGAGQDAVGCIGKHRDLGYTPILEAVTLDVPGLAVRGSSGDDSMLGADVHDGFHFLPLSLTLPRPGGGDQTL